MTDPAIETVELTRRFGTGGNRSVALDSVSLTVERGECIALLGVNGAGKTTLTKILSTLLAPSSGSARIFGHDVASEARRVRSQTSAVFGGERGLYPRISARANLRFFGMLAGVDRHSLHSRSEQLLSQVGLSDAASIRVENFSKGMRQRLQLAIAFMTEPAVLLLDEPTLGLDPIEAQRLRNTVRRMRQSGTTVLLTSHHLLDVQELAERVVLLDKGRLKADEGIGEFVARAGHAAEVSATLLGPVTVNPSPGVHVVGVDRQGEVTRVVLRLDAWSSETFSAIGRMLEGGTVVDIDVRPASLEDAFAHLVEGAG